MGITICNVKVTKWFKTQLLFQVGELPFTDLNMEHIDHGPQRPILKEHHEELLSTLY